MIRIIFWSIISNVAGTRPRAMTAETAAPASSTESKAAIMVFRAGGLRSRRALAEVTMPRVPSLGQARVLRLPLVERGAEDELHDEEKRRLVLAEVEEPDHVGV